VVSEDFGDLQFCLVHPALPTGFDVLRCDTSTIKPRCCILYILFLVDRHKLHGESQIHHTCQRKARSQGIKCITSSLSIGI
jgi:hypothetical protein